MFKLISGFAGAYIANIYSGMLGWFSFGGRGKQKV